MTEKPPQRVHVASFNAGAAFCRRVVADLAEATAANARLSPLRRAATVELLRAIHDVLQAAHLEACGEFAGLPDGKDLT